MATKVLHVSAELHKKLRFLAYRDDRSLQEVADKVLENGLAAECLPAPSDLVPDSSLRRQLEPA
jgi:plasmid stability protein